MAGRLGGIIGFGRCRTLMISNPIEMKKPSIHYGRKAFSSPLVPQVGVKCKKTYKIKFLCYRIYTHGIEIAPGSDVVGKYDQWQRHHGSLSSAGEWIQDFVSVRKPGVKRQPQGLNLRAFF